MFNTGKYSNRDEQILDALERSLVEVYRAYDPPPLDEFTTARLRRGIMDNISLEEANKHRAGYANDCYTVPPPAAATLLALALSTVAGLQLTEIVDLMMSFSHNSIPELMFI